MTARYRVAGRGTTTGSPFVPPISILLQLNLEGTAAVSVKRGWELGMKPQAIRKSQEGFLLRS
jgi:hypothetical protein